MRMFRLHRRFVQKLPRLRPASCRPKFCQNQPPPTPTKPVKCESKVKFCWRWCSKPADTFAYYASCGDWVTGWTNRRRVQRNISVSSRHCGTDNHPIPLPCFILFFSWHEAKLDEGVYAQSHSCLVSSPGRFLLCGWAGGARRDSAQYGHGQHRTGDFDATAGRDNSGGPCIL